MELLPDNRITPSLVADPEIFLVLERPRVGLTSVTLPDQEGSRICKVAIALSCCFI